jgi:hypothetical protein
MKNKTYLALALALTLSLSTCVSAASGESTASVSAEAQAVEFMRSSSGMQLIRICRLYRTPRYYMSF